MPRRLQFRFPFYDLLRSYIPETMNMNIQICHMYSKNIYREKHKNQFIKTVLLLIHETYIVFISIIFTNPINPIT